MPRTLLADEAAAENVAANRCCRHPCSRARNRRRECKNVGTLVQARVFSGDLGGPEKAEVVLVEVVLGGRTRAPPDPSIYVGAQPPHVNGGSGGRAGAPQNYFCKNHLCFFLIE